MLADLCSVEEDHHVKPFTATQRVAQLSPRLFDPPCHKERFMPSFRFTAFALPLLAMAPGLSGNTIFADQPAPIPNRPVVPGTFRLHLRERKETAPKSGRFQVVERETDWRVAETVIIICDMWEDHPCQNFLEQLGIRNVVLMGVHTHYCVLGRSFGIRAMVKLGKNVVLCRDLTDAMYDPRKPPYVSHQRGTELAVEHIEKYWCPSITSGDLLTVVPGSADPVPAAKGQ
jgi:hypothetical protein